MNEKTEPTRTIGAVINELTEAKERRKLLDAQVESMKQNEYKLEGELLALLDGEDTTMGSGKTKTAVITETQVPNVDDWAAFYAHISENEAWHLLQRRPAGPACRETFQAGEDIPGVSLFTKRAISLRKNP